MALTISNTTAASSGGIDVQALVDQVLYADRAPERLWQQQQANLNLEAAAYRTINSNLLSLKAATDSLKDFSGAFQAKIVSSSNPALVTATADSSAVTGNHTITVSTLTTTSSYYSARLTSSSTTFATGSFDLKIGTADPVTIQVDGTRKTLDGLASYINGQNLGVTASVINDAGGARLALVSKTSGAAGDLTITNNTSGVSFQTLEVDNKTQGVNASLTVDGIPVSSASNVVENVIPGVTLTLADRTSAAITLSVKPDTTQVASMINSFVSDYNAAMNAINLQFKFDPTTNSAPPLAGDSTLQIVQQQLLQNVAFSISGNDGITSLYSIGVKMNDDGSLTVDDTKLNAVLESNFQNVQNLFQSVSPDGFAINFSSVINGLTGSVSGPLNTALKGVTTDYDNLADQITNFEAQLAATQKQLYDQYGRIDTILRQLPLMLQQISSQLSYTQSTR